MSRISPHPTERDRYGLNMALAALARREQTYPGAADIVRCLLGQIDNEHATKEPSYDALLCEVETLRKDAERWRYVSLQGDDTHWLNLLRVDLEDFGGNINAAVDALIDSEAPAKEATQ